MGDGHAALAGLDDRLERVGELRDDRHPQRGVAGVGAEAAGRVRHLRARDLPHHPAAETLQQLLRRRHVRDRLDVAVADADVGLAGEQRRQQQRDVAAGVLVVGVGVDDVVGAQLQRGVDAGGEGGGQPLAAAEAHHVVDAAGAGDLGRAVARAVVDHQPLDDVDAGHGGRQIAQRAGQRLGLVQARDLDDQLRHAPTSRSMTPCQVTSEARAWPASPSPAA